MAYDMAHGARQVEESTLSEQLYRRIEHQEWIEAANLVRSHPEIITIPYRRHGWTLLHWLCSMGGTPASLLDLVASLHPDAIAVPDTFIGDSALNLVARNCQLNAEKIVRLLQYCDPSILLIRNRLGGTALHSAANHNAVLPALQALVNKNPAILNVSTHEGIHAVTALWLAYTQTIPGYMTVARILNEGQQMEPGGNAVWDRFWAKVEYLALQNYWSKQPERRQSTAEAANPSNSDHVAHGLLMCNVPINLFKTCIKHVPQSATAVDASSGNRPLHILIENRPYRLKEREAIVACLEASREAAGFANAEGDVPLQIAIRNKIPWDNGVDLLMEAAPETVCRQDRATALYPFQLAACQGGKQAVDTAFHLLRRQPDLLPGGYRR